MKRGVVCCFPFTYYLNYNAKTSLKKIIIQKHKELTFDKTHLETCHLILKI